MLLILGREWRLPPRYMVLTIAATLAMFPSMANFTLGQAAWFLLGTTCLYFWSLYKRKDLLAGLSLALISIRPQYCLFFLIPAVVNRRWRLLAYFASGMVALLLLAGFTLGWRTVLDYPQVVLYAESTGKHLWGAGVQRNLVSIRALLNLFLPTALSVQVGLLLFLISLLFSAWLWLKSKNQDNQTFAWLVSITILLALISSPHTYVYDLCLLALTFMTLKQVSSFKSFQAMPFSLRIWYVLLVAYPILSWCARFLATCPDTAALVVQAPGILFPLINIALLVVAAFYYCRTRVD